MPHTPSGGGSIAAAEIALPLGDDVDERLAVEAQRHRPPQIGIVERRLMRLMIIVRLTLIAVTSQIACGAWLLKSFNVGIVTP